MHQLIISESKASAASFPFLKYSLKQWLPHAKAVEEAGVTQEDLLEYLPA
jgi:hypothetical protein